MTYTAPDQKINILNYSVLCITVHTNSNITANIHGMDFVLYTQAMKYHEKAIGVNNNYDHSVNQFHRRPWCSQSFLSTITW